MANDSYEAPHGYDEHGADDTENGIKMPEVKPERWREPRNPGWVNERTPGEASAQEPGNRTGAANGVSGGSESKRGGSAGGAGRRDAGNTVRAHYRHRTRARAGEYGKPYHGGWEPPSRDEVNDAAKAVIDGARNVWGVAKRTVAKKTGADKARKPTKRN